MPITLEAPHNINDALQELALAYTSLKVVEADLCRVQLIHLLGAVLIHVVENALDQLDK